MKLSGNIVNVLDGTIYAGTLVIRDGIITDIVPEHTVYPHYIIPGFIDSHVHTESSMLTPSEFARIAVSHGTIACVSDPHEIANVLGVDGVRYMVADSAHSLFTFSFGVPSCVPATPFESAGARIGVEETGNLISQPVLSYLSEMMNVPGVLNNDPEVMAKIALAKEHGKPIDGHAPGLRGEELKRYIAAGISTDHEFLDKDEALEKIGLGMKLQIREGSAAKTFDDLYILMGDHSEACMLCSDDKHPDDLIRGHINVLVKKAVSSGIDVMKVLRCACVNPVLHYGINTGLLRRGDRADFIVVDNLTDFTILETVIKGTVVARNGKTLLAHRPSTTVNRFQATGRSVSDFHVLPRGDSVRIIEAVDGSLVTNSTVEKARVVDGNTVSDPERDILKITVVNRYNDGIPAVAFARNFGIKKGAIASSVAHDSHNIIAVGTSDEMICRAINLVINNRGGISVVSDTLEEALALPVAGIMANEDGFTVAGKFVRLEKAAKSLGTSLSAPFMTLSFMALLVIPKLKLSDKGLFDGESFRFIDLFP